MWTPRVTICTRQIQRNRNKNYNLSFPFWGNEMKQFPVNHLFDENQNIVKSRQFLKFKYDISGISHKAQRSKYYNIKIIFLQKNNLQFSEETESSNILSFTAGSWHLSKSSFSQILGMTDIYGLSNGARQDKARDCRDSIAILNNCVPDRFIKYS